MENQKKYKKSEIAKDLIEFNKIRDLQIKSMMEKYPDLLIPYQPDGKFINFMVREDLLISDSIDNAIDTENPK